MEAFSMRQNLGEKMAYRGDFFVSFGAMAISGLTQFLYILLIYYISSGFEGWTIQQMLLLVGFVSLGEGIAYVSIAGVLWGTIERVHSGEFDVILLAPGNSLAYLIVRSFDTEDAGMLISGIVLFIGGVVYAGVSLGQALLLALLSLVPAVFIGAAAIFGSALAIKYIATWRIYEFINIITRCAKYPVTIYPKMLAIVFITALPLTAAGLIPVGVVTGNLPLASLISIVFVGVFTWLAVKYWHKVLKDYTSAGG